MAPIKVPNAWAKKGKIKFLGPNKCMLAFKPSMVVKSAPSGGGIIEPLMLIIPILTILPRTIPPITANAFFAVGLMILFYTTKCIDFFGNDAF
jgi:hypothetical protein